MRADKGTLNWRDSGREARKLGCWEAGHTVRFRSHSFQLSLLLHLFPPVQELKCE